MLRVSEMQILERGRRVSLLRVWERGKGLMLLEDHLDRAEGIRVNVRVEAIKVKARVGARAR